MILVHFSAVGGGQETAFASLACFVRLCFGFVLTVLFDRLALVLFDDFCWIDF